MWWKSPYGYSKLCNIKTHKKICIQKFARRTWVYLTQQYGKNRQRCKQNKFYYAVWQLLLYFYREFSSKILSVYIAVPIAFYRSISHYGAGSHWSQSNKTPRFMMNFMPRTLENFKEINDSNCFSISLDILTWTNMNVTVISRVSTYYNSFYKISIVDSLMYLVLIFFLIRHILFIFANSALFLERELI